MIMKVKNTNAPGSSSDVNLCFLQSGTMNSCSAGEDLLLSLVNVYAQDDFPSVIMPET